MIILIFGHFWKIKVCKWFTIAFVLFCAAIPDNIKFSHVSVESIFVKNSNVFYRIVKYTCYDINQLWNKKLYFDRILKKHYIYRVKCMF